MHRSRLDQHKERVGFLSDLFIDVVTNNAKALSRPDAKSILDPTGLLHNSGTVLTEAIAALSTERANVYFDLIEKQKALADAGIERVKVLHDHFDFYAGEVLGGKAWAAKTDVMQQSQDVAIMFVCSESALKFAAQYTPVIDPKYIRYKALLDRQYSELRAFQALKMDDDKNLVLSGRTYDDMESTRARDEIERVTLNVSNRNMDLSEAVENLLCNQARCLYAWSRLIDSPSPDSLAYPRDDIKFETDLVSTYLERIKALTTRYEKNWALASKINPEP